MAWFGVKSKGLLTPFMSNPAPNRVEHHDVQEKTQPTAAPEAQIAVDGAAVEAMATVGEVAETAKTTAAKKASGQKSDDGAQGQQKQDDATLSDREALRQRLLSKAPKTPAMRAQVRRQLEKKRDKLESDVRKYRRKKNYHGLTKAICQLRMVVRQLEELARMSLEKLQNVWLEVVHRFA